MKKLIVILILLSGCSKDTRTPCDRLVDQRETIMNKWWGNDEKDRKARDYLMKITDSLIVVVCDSVN